MTQKDSQISYEALKKPNGILPGAVLRPEILETKAGKVEIDITDRDAPILMGSPGGMGGIDQCRLTLQFAADDFRLLSLSRPGYLGTPLGSGESIEAQADLFAAVLDELGIEKVALFSISAGGPYAYTFAARHPDRIWALVAVDSVSGYYDIPESSGPITQMIFLSDIGQKLLAKMTELEPDAFIKEIFRAEGYFTKKQLQEHLDFVMNDPDARAFAVAFMNTINPYRPRRPGTENDMAQTRVLHHLDLEPIRCPTLIVHGTHDSDVKFYDGVYAHEHIRGSERFWIEEGSHTGFWLNRHAKEAQQHVLDFLHRNRPE